MAMHLIFSAEQQDVLRGMHGQADTDYVWGGKGYKAVASRHVATLAVVYETEDGENAVVGTTLHDTENPASFRDIVDLGPVGKCLGTFEGNGRVPAPRQAMLVPRDRVGGLLAGTLSLVEVVAASEAARDLAERVAAPAPGM